MATSCLMTMSTISRSIFDSVGFNRERIQEYHKRLFEEAVKLLALEEEESSEEDIDEFIPDLLVELEYLSLIFKLWLRSINREEGRDSVKHHKLQDLEHAILTTEESVIKPYKKFLMLNQYKRIEELLLEPMFQAYRQVLEKQCAKVSIEKEKANFKMAEEDRISLNKNTVYVCSSLGLKLDFLDRLEGMSQKNRGHRNLCDWVVIFLRKKYESLGFTDKDSLDEEMLDKIGFDPLSSAVETILARAHNMSDMQQHIDACEWAESFVEDEFQYNPALFPQQNERFPFENNKTNEWFKFSNVELNSYDEHCHCQVNIMNVVTKETEASLATTRSLLRKFEDEQHTLLFHGTDHESAIDILDGRGIHLCSGRQNRDFSSGKGFYLTKNVNDALNWASSKTAKPAILVFRVNRAFLNSKTRKLTLNQQDMENWREIVTLFRSGKQSAKTKLILREYDLIEGPLATVRRGTSNGELVFEPKPSSYQMCLISDEFAESFQQNLHSILFY